MKNILLLMMMMMVKMTTTMGAPPPCLQNFIEMKPITYMACLSIDRCRCVFVFVFVSLTFVAYSWNVSISLASNHNSQYVVQYEMWNIFWHDVKCSLVTFQCNGLIIVSRKMCTSKMGNYLPLAFLLSMRKSSLNFMCIYVYIKSHEKVFFFSSSLFRIYVN